MSATMVEQTSDRILVSELIKCTKEGNYDGCKDVMSEIKDTDNWQTHYYDKSGDSIGILAARWGQTKILKYLHEDHGLSLELSNFDGKRPLHEAAQFGHLETLKYLLSSGVDIDCLKRADWTPLMLACTKNNIDIVKELIECNADLLRRNKDGWNCFHVACREGHPDILNILLDSNPNIGSTVSKNGRTPLHTAALQGCKGAVEVLLARCSYDPDVQDSCGTTPFMDAIRAGYTDVAKVLLEKQKVDISRRDNLHRQPVHLAAESGQLASVEFLVLEHGVDLNSRTDNGTTPLHFAAKEGHEKMLELLLKLRSNITAVDYKNRTALHMASGGQFAPCVQLLLKAGATDTMDTNRQFARDLARKQNVKDCFTHSKIS